MNQHKNTDEDFNIFIADSIYPEASAVFTWRLRPIEDIKDECIVVLDANTLLVPYTISPKSLDEIGLTYKTLVEQNRLVVPGRVAREFATHRATKLTELHQNLETRKSQVRKLQKGKYPLLEGLEEYQETLRLEREIDKLSKQYQEALTQVTNHVRRWTWNDPVSLLYGSLFHERVVLDPNFDKKDIKDDLQRRQTHKIPPGYKDAGKETEGVGDLLIWRTILKIAEDREKSVVFVSNDEKPDWWHQSGGALYPRYELTDEFRRHSKGESFHVLKFSDFLDLYGVDKEVVEEVRQEEAQSSRASENAVFYSDMHKLASLAEEAVGDWLGYSQPTATIVARRVGFPDFVVFEETGIKAGYEVRVMRSPRLGTLRRIREVVNQGHVLVGDGQLHAFYVVLVGESESEAREIATLVDSRQLVIPSSVSVIVGMLVPPEKGQETSHTFIPMSQHGGSEDNNSMS